MDIFPLFPTAVCKFKLEREFTKEETDVVKDVEKSVRPNKGNLTSTDNYVFDRPELSAIREFAEAGVREYFEKIICPAGDVKPYITMSWFNFTDKGGSHHKHCHGNSIISGVIYFRAVDNVDKIYFYNENYKAIDLVPKEYNTYNSGSWWLPVEEKTMFIFPSDLMHSVETVQTDTTRISLAFNVFVKGGFGNKDDLKWLSLE